MNVFLALPAYNEECALPSLLAAVQQAMMESRTPCRVVIVDDGSTDATCRVVQEWSARLSIDLVCHSENRGLGETIRDALRWASERAAVEDIIVTMDADNTHSPALIPQMVQCAANGNDVVIASRYRRGSKVVGLSAFRRLMSYGARVVMQFLCPLPGVRDYTCGYRAYRVGVVQRAFAAYGDAFVTEPGFTCMAEILLKLGSMGVRMCEIPMVLHYDQKTGASKMRVGSTIWKTFQLIFRHRC
ncbi:MAG: glycosyltransferase [Acidobacteria bacterium]|nr:glycosyltransferase [Acidobacteriota bacterium]